MSNMSARDIERFELQLPTPNRLPGVVLCCVVCQSPVQYFTVRPDVDMRAIIESMEDHTAEKHSRACPDPRHS